MPFPAAVRTRFRLVTIAGAMLAAACGGDDPSGPDEPGETRTTMTGIGAGGAHSCALRQDGAAFCWGRNTSGQLGDGTTEDRLTPVAVIGGHRFRSIGAGDTHTCAVTFANQAYCWGDNVHGQVGGGLAAATNVPPTLVGNMAFTSVSAGQDHSCGVTPTATAYCWGEAYLGDADIRTRRATPVAVAGGPWGHISAGANYTCAIAANGSAYCWGVNAGGTLGIGSDETPRPTPTLVAGGRTYAAITAGIGHACAIAVTTDTWCWGNNTVGQLGAGSTTPASSNVPVLVSGDRDFDFIDSGELHTCGATRSTTYCWGRGTLGQLGTGNLVQQTAPAPVVDVAFAYVSTFRSHTCGVTTAGDGYCWGGNAFGETGKGATSPREVRPVLVTLPAATR